jgi:GH15 family glucan-1,4-alpha-glucosidase
MAWVAADRAVKAIEHFQLNGPLDRWRQLRQEIHDQVCRQGFDPELNAFVQYYGAKQFDASLLMLPLVGFLPATDPRICGTVEAIEQRLLRDGFVDRYPTLPDKSLRTRACHRKAAAIDNAAIRGCVVRPGPVLV